MSTNNPFSNFNRLVSVIGLPLPGLEELEKKLSDEEKIEALAKKLAEKLNDDTFKTKIYKLDNNQARPLGKKAGFILICEYHLPGVTEKPFNIFIYFSIESKIIDISSEAIPAFDEKTPIQTQFDKLNKWNKENPFMKFYIRTKKICVATELSVEEGGNLDLILKRVHLLAAKVVYISQEREASIE